MKIAVDAMGGDFGPAVVVEGAVAARREFGLESVLVGDKSAIEREITRLGAQELAITVRHASQVVGMAEPPSQALRRKRGMTQVQLGQAIGVTQARIVEFESERFDQMQLCAGIGAQPDHVAGIGRNLRLVEHDMQHARIIARRSLVVSRAERAGSRA